MHHTQIGKIPGEQEHEQTAMIRKKKSSEPTARALLVRNCVTALTIRGEQNLAQANSSPSTRGSAMTEAIQGERIQAETLNLHMLRKRTKEGQALRNREATAKSRAKQGWAQVVMTQASNQTERWQTIPCCRSSKSTSWGQGAKSSWQTVAVLKLRPTELAKTSPNETCCAKTAMSLNSQS